MPARFSVLSSSSSGNVSYLDVDGHGVLVDFGVGPRKLVRLLDSVRATWDKVAAVVLTHLHSDHWSKATLKLLAKTGTPLWCHAEHVADLRGRDDAFDEMERAGLVHRYQANRAFDLGPCRCTPLSLRHDVVTFGFRFDGVREPWALGYAADLGTWAGDLADRLADVDLLAIEFNHDVEMELASRRSQYLVQRVLGDLGHLSNEQAARLLTAIIRRTSPGRLRHLVPLHLSRECNHPKLVRAVAEEVRDRHRATFTIHPAHHCVPTPWFHLSHSRKFAQPDLFAHFDDVADAI